MDDNVLTKKLTDLERRLNSHGSQHEAAGSDSVRTLAINAAGVEVGKARRIGFTAPLTAVYDRTTDTVNVSYTGSGAGSLLDADTVDGKHASSFIETIRTVYAGSGLSGGGSLGSNITIDVGAGDGIYVDADTTNVNQNYDFKWTAKHKFYEGLGIGGNESLTFGEDVEFKRLATDTLTMGAGDCLQSPTFMSGILGWRLGADGDAEFQNAWIRGELHTSVFVKNEMHASGGTLVILNAGKIAKAINASDNILAAVGSTMNLVVDASQDDASCLFVKGDVLRLKGFISK